MRALAIATRALPVFNQRVSEAKAFRYEQWREVFFQEMALDDSDTLRAKADGIKQQATQSVREYLQKKKEAYMRAGGVSEKEMIHVLTEGLQSRLRAAILSRSGPEKAKTVRALEDQILAAELAANVSNQAWREQRSNPRVGAAVATESSIVGDYVALPARKVKEKAESGDAVMEDGSKADAPNTLVPPPNTAPISATVSDLRSGVRDAVVDAMKLMMQQTTGRRTGRGQECQGLCWYCGEAGHMRRSCAKYAKAQALKRKPRGGKAGTPVEMVVIPQDNPQAGQDGAVTSVPL